MGAGPARLGSVRALERIDDAIAIAHREMHVWKLRLAGKADEAEQFRVARVATIVIAVLAVILGILFEGQNVAFMAGLAFSIACAANFPSLVLAITWSASPLRPPLPVSSWAR